MAGSTGVLPPPKGYLKRLREICDKYGILLIFDEVITGFGRLGFAFAAERYGVIPDMITFAKGVTSGTVPMGGVIVRKGIYEAFMKGPEHAIELFHGYTYSGHPLACAAALATIDVYREEKLFERVRALEPKWYDALMTLKGLPNVLDIRCVGLDRRHRPRADSRRRRPARLSRCWTIPSTKQGLMLRLAGDTHRTDAALHHQRRPDRRDRRQGGHVDQGGGVSLGRLARARGRARKLRAWPGPIQLVKCLAPTAPGPSVANEQSAAGVRFASWKGIAGICDIPATSGAAARRGPTRPSPAQRQSAPPPPCGL